MVNDIRKMIDKINHFNQYVNEGVINQSYYRIITKFLLLKIKNNIELTKIILVFFLTFSLYLLKIFQKVYKS